MNASSQRWRERRSRFVGDGPLIRPAEYTVDLLHPTAAKAFVERHHYSGSFPADRLSCGLFRGRELVGVCTFSVGMNPAAAPKRAGLDAANVVDLGRLVLFDDIPGNGETWFVARAFRLLRAEKPEVEAVVSYSDPAARRDASGRLVKPGHIGVVYQGLGAHYRGQATPRLERVTPDGQPIAERVLQKIRAGEQGCAYATDEVIRRGARRPRMDETPREWLAALEAEGFLRTQRHPGNHVYAWALTDRAKAASAGLPRLPYPKLGRRGDRDATALPLFGEAA